MYSRHPAATGLVIACLGLTAALASRPADARRAIPDMRGSYFGTLRDFRGNLRQCDAVIVSQNANWVGGLLNIAAIPQGAGMRGTVNSRGRMTLTAQSSQGRQVRIKLRARYEAEPELNRVMLVGTYVITGGIRESGTFELRGANN